MSRPAISILAFAVYMLGLGLIVLIAPNALLALFNLPATSEVWIRVVGVLLLLIAFYYFQAARHELTQFFGWTVYARSSVIVFFVVFVLLGFVSPVLILFGVIDLLGAIWTALALRARPS
ncbi:MAG TPA: hypothetical protein VL334_11540 [Anaerolineae bacterium]|nr:hypothetical protein [Anaerolineae bacterium]